MSCKAFYTLGMHLKKYKMSCKAGIVCFSQAHVRLELYVYQAHVRLELYVCQAHVRLALYVYQAHVRLES